MTDPSSSSKRSLPRGGPSTYWRESTQPLASLMFVMPLVLTYEIGLLVLGREAIRNGADALMRNILQLLGFGQYFLLPSLLVGLLLGWHHTTARPWRVSSRVLAGMLIESLLLALGLLVIAHLHGYLFQQAVAMLGSISAAPPLQISPQRASRLVAFCGAGVYEELLFRLILLSLVMGIIRRAGGEATATLAVSVVVTSLLFSAAHYRVFMGYGDPFRWAGFLFRFIAGAYFAGLYLKRGFGIAAGTHALYNIFTDLF